MESNQPIERSLTLRCTQFAAFLSFYLLLLLFFSFLKRERDFSRIIGSKAADGLEDDCEDGYRWMSRANLLNSIQVNTSSSQKEEEKKNKTRPSMIRSCTSEPTVSLIADTAAFFSLSGARIEEEKRKKKEGGKKKQRQWRPMNGSIACLIATEDKGKERERETLNQNTHARDTIALLYHPIAAIILSVCLSLFLSPPPPPSPFPPGTFVSPIFPDVDRHRLDS